MSDIEFITPARIGDGKCVRCGTSRSERQRISRTGMDEPPFEIRCVNVMWCGKRQGRGR